ncbi:MAG TPA: S1 RNA-binding domain-containing protein [Anaerolineales bacterium]|nr:S1 RNA-binding domain-containing protein [Anaerolineales bacterium]
MEENILATTEHAEIIGLSDIKRKMHLTGSVIKTTLAGAIVDIGLETPGVVHISQLQKDPVNKVEDVVQVGQTVEVWVRRVDPNRGRIDLTMVEPLALEWREIEKGMVLRGKVSRLEKFGAFIDIGAERPGLVHISEMTHDYIRTPGEFVKEGDEVEVKVLGVNRRKKQIKLSMKALEEKPVKPPKPAQKEKDSVKEVAAAPAVKEETIPTAMEMALRDAMERAKTRQDETASKGKRKPVTNAEMEKILSRTLENKVKTASK